MPLALRTSECLAAGDDFLVEAYQRLFRWGLGWVVVVFKVVTVTLDWATQRLWTLQQIHAVLKISCEPPVWVLERWVLQLSRHLPSQGWYPHISWMSDCNQWFLLPSSHPVIPTINTLFRKHRPLNLYTRTTKIVPTIEHWRYDKSDGHPVKEKNSKFSCTIQSRVFVVVLSDEFH